MRMCRLPLSLLLFMLGLIPAAFAQSSALDADFSALLQNVGEEVTPNLHRSVFSGQTLDGEPIKKISFSVIEYGAAFSDGLAHILNPGAHNWQYSTPLPTIIDENNAKWDTARDFLKDTRDSYTYSAWKLGVGVPLSNDFDAIIDFCYVPSALTSWIFDNCLPSKLDSLSAKYSTFSLNAKIRKKIIAEHGPIPTVMAGVGLAFASSSGEVKASSLNELSGSQILTSDGTSNIDFGGSCKFTTVVAGTGLDLIVTKRFQIMAPYVKLSTYYFCSRYEADPDIVATITDNTTHVQTFQTIDTPVSVTESRFSFLMTGGINLHMDPVVFATSATIEPRDFKTSTADHSLTGTAISGMTLNLGLDIML